MIPGGAPAARKLLLVGWDGADWKLITPLMERGQMPSLASLVERGIMGRLSSLAPMVSPLLWTTVATGKRADKHGVLLRAELDPQAGILRPISRVARKTAAVWNVLHHAGLETHVVNWPASHPAEVVSGVFVSDSYPKVVAAFGEPWPLEPGTISPGRVESTLAELRVHPGELCGEQLLPFVPQLEQVDQLDDTRVVSVAEVLAETTSVHAAATWILENEPWDVMAVQYGGIERLGHQFIRYQHPRMPHITERDCELYGDVMTAGYRFHDLLLGRLLELVGDDATVMLVSDHGFCTGEFRPRGQESLMQWHRGFGVFCLAGAGIRQDELIYQASILDVTPTILTLFDLPVGDDMDGRPLLAVWESPPSPARIPSWDIIIGSGPAVRAAEPTSSEQDDAFAELEALGYTDVLQTILESLTQGMRRSEHYHLALVHMDAGRDERAVVLLQQLLDEQPDDAVVRLSLAYCHCRLGDYGRTREALDGLEDSEDGLSKEKYLLRAMVLIAEHKAQDALQCLQLAAETHLREPQVFSLRGRAYLRLERYAEAERAFREALAIDEDSIAAHMGLAVTFARQRQWDAAADAALTVVGLDHHQGDAHYLLGVALFHLHRPVRAALAFETVLSLQPERAPAEKWLAALREGYPRPPLEALLGR